MGSPATATFGPIMIGVIFNVLLYGIMLTQTYLYFTHYKSDKTWMKIFVAFLIMFDTINCAFDISFMYIPLIVNFGNDESLANASWLHSTDPVMTGIIAILVQGFFAWRILVLTRSKPLTGAVALCSIAQFVGAVGATIGIIRVPQFEQFRKFEMWVALWLASSAMADSIIAFSLVIFLRRHKGGFSGTNDIVNRIIRLTVQTGLLCALCAITDLILFLVSPTGLHLIFNLPLSKLYSNSLMSSLNSRHGWKFGDAIGVDSDFVQSGLNMTPTRAVPDRKSTYEYPRPPRPSIVVTVGLDSVSDQDMALA